MPCPSIGADDDFGAQLIAKLLLPQVKRACSEKLVVVKMRVDEQDFHDDRAIRTHPRSTGEWQVVLPRPINFQAYTLCVMAKSKIEKPLPVLGIMSGTSIDSVDYALCEVTLESVRLRDYWQVNFPKQLQAQLHAIARNSATSYETGQAHHDLGRFYVAGALRGSGKIKPQLIGLHGQTVYHNPDKKSPATLQLGEPVYLTEALRAPVINNFRVADLAAGGQGAPLATLFHKVVFGQAGKHVCVNNLGGISNVTSLNWRRGTKPRVLAFDTGPANMLMDLCIREITGGKQDYDRGGKWAAKGKVAEALLASWLEHPYFAMKPPKSTGRELFGEPFFRKAQKQMQASKLSPEDQVATLTEFTARSLALNYRLHLRSRPELVALAGGGAANPFLVRRITEALRVDNPTVTVKTSDALGWSAQSIEPAAFALLAYYRWMGMPGNLPETTGAKRAVLCGQITEP